MKKLLFTAPLAYFFFATQKVQAAISNPVIGQLGTSENTAGGGKFLTYVVTLWRTAINLAALVVLVFFVVGAFEWLTAGSDTKKVESARNRIMNAVIGMVLLVGSFTLLSFLSKVLFGSDFNLLKLTFPTYSF
jgi:hypothetical protein